MGCNAWKTERHEWGQENKLNKASNLIEDKKEKNLIHVDNVPSENEKHLPSH